MSHTRREVEVDTALAEIYHQEMVLFMELDRAANTIHRMSGSEKEDRYYGRQKFTRWERSLEEAIQAGPVHEWDRRAWDRILEARDEALVTQEDLRDRKHLLDDEYRAAPWSRFFIVPGGHIHSSMACSTCNRNNTNTMFGWLPQLSGLDEAAAVKDQGALLCTVCFPSAPVEWTNQLELDEQAKLAASCPGSGTMADRDDPLQVHFRERKLGALNRGHGYATCPSCGEVRAVLQSGKFRKHQPKEAS